jgi:hypothetical protein
MMLFEEDRKLVLERVVDAVRRHARIQQQAQAS